MALKTALPASTPRDRVRAWPELQRDADLGVVLATVMACRTAAEELGPRQELLVHLQAASEPDGGIVVRRHLLEGLRGGFARFGPVG